MQPTYLQPLPRGELPLVVLLRHALCAAPLLRLPLGLLNAVPDGLQSRCRQREAGSLWAA